MTTIVLMGLMGAGKTTVGRRLADRLGVPFVDSDRAIEVATGSSVRELWESGGEAAYRHLESTFMLDALADDRPSVVAAPGGVVLDPEVRAALGRAFVVWLRVDPTTSAARVRPGDHRPLLGDDPTAALTKMSVERAEVYSRLADAVVDADTGDPDALADQIERLHLRPANASNDHR